MADELRPFRDLGLSYQQAAHGVQTAVAYRMSNGSTEAEPKHLRVGIDMSKVEQSGLARLLIDKGVFSLEEYVEYIRLATNEEVAREQLSAGPGIQFR